MPVFSDVESPPAVIPPANDFWRTGPGGALPDGVNDVTEDIQRTGLVGIGNIPAADPVAQLDVALGGRSGVDGRVPGVTPLYVTGNIPGINGTVTNPPATLTGGVEFRHSNQTQGIGIGYDSIYCTGSAANQAFNFINRGNGQTTFYQQTLNGGFNFYNYVSEAIATNQGWQERHFAAGVQEFNILRRRSGLVLPGGGTLANEMFFQTRIENGATHNALALRNSLCNANTGRVEIGGNAVNDDKLVLFGVDSTSFYGFGIKASTLAYFVSSTTAFHRFYAGPCPSTLLFSVSGVGNVTVDPNGTAAGGFTGPLLRFGSETSVEAIKSQRTVVDRFQNDIEIHTAAARRFAVLANGRIYMATVPTFATDALAGAGGLATGEVYKDVFGALRIKL